MAKVHGKDGSITFAGGYTTHIHAMTCDRALEMAEATVLGSENRTKIAGLGTATGTFSCYVDGTTPLVDVGTTGTLIMTLATGRTITATIVTSGLTVNVSLDGVEVATYRWELSGTGAAADFVIA
jgi:hypothetical protein